MHKNVYAQTLQAKTNNFHFYHYIFATFCVATQFLPFAIATYTTRQSANYP